MLALSMKLRSLAFASVLGLGAAVTLSACAVPAEEDPESEWEGPEGASTDPITNVAHTPVERQSIGNCWIYAHASFLESLVLQHSGQAIDLSQSYWTYWHWFEGIVAEDLEKGEVSTGGGYGVAAELTTRYGLALETDFVPEDSSNEMSGRQKAALTAINVSLKTGALSTREARRNRALVRAELDKAWQLSAKVVTDLDTVFGKSVTRTLDRSTVSTAGRLVKRPTALQVGRVKTSTGYTKTLTVKDVLGTKASTWDLDTRVGTYAWSEASYPRTTTARRAFQKRIQKALHDKKPVIISWLVDFNSLDGQGRFAALPSTVGSQGGHMTVLEDYEITDVPGFGTLPAGTDETRPEALAAALSDQAKITFFRVKNSWGSSRIDRQFVLPGYHDLYTAYLNGPMKWCSGEERPCKSSYDMTPFTAVVLPPGY